MDLQYLGGIEFFGTSTQENDTFGFGWNHFLESFEINWSCCSGNPLEVEMLIADMPVMCATKH